MVLTQHFFSKPRVFQTKIVHTASRCGHSRSTNRTLEPWKLMKTDRSDSPSWRWEITQMDNWDVESSGVLKGFYGGFRKMMFGFVFFEICCFCFMLLRLTVLTGLRCVFVNKKARGRCLPSWNLWTFWVLWFCCKELIVTTENIWDDGSQFAKSSWVFLFFLLVFLPSREIRGPETTSTSYPHAKGLRWWWWQDFRTHRAPYLWKCRPTELCNVFEALIVSLFGWTPSENSQRLPPPLSIRLVWEQVI